MSGLLSDRFALVANMLFVNVVIRVLCRGEKYQISVLSIRRSYSILDRQ